jgi:transcriptional repressor NrdR
MRCPFCQNSDSRVLESRPHADGPCIRRRRECCACAKRWTTQERFEVVALTVVKHNGERQGYDRHKLLQSLQFACQKTGVSESQIEGLVDELEMELYEEAHGEITTQTLGHWVLNKLRILNEVAYVRFASIYQNFQSVEDFVALYRRRGKIERASELS